MSKNKFSSMRLFWFFMMMMLVGVAWSQQTISGLVTDEVGEPLPFANVYLQHHAIGSETNDEGRFEIEHALTGVQVLVVSYTGFLPKKISINTNESTMYLEITLQEDATLEEVVVSGTLQPVNRLKTAIPVEVYTTKFLKKNPTPNVFEALQNINGVRPQLNCNICNTGDIHINGLEGPYTMILIDGMPIVSGLSTVYGLSGIPNSLIDHIEVVKGPASSLYGSEAVGGLINVITKNALVAPKVSVDAYTTSWLENNLDVGLRSNLGEKVSLLTGVNAYFYDNPVDNNNDNFTDVTLQKRISVFQKIAFQREDHKKFDIATRYYYEDRWGGEIQWNSGYRGGSEVYGESIYTNRAEVLSTYQLPTDANVFFNTSYTFHNQNSVYGDVLYKAKQHIGFGQLTYFPEIKNHEVVLGLAAKYNYYNDNTAATVKADEVLIPGVFAQDEITLSKQHSVLLGARLDYDKRHGSIFTPRLAYKFSGTKDGVFRVNFGTGFRTVSLFTEEHAALTGAREVIIEEHLDPEASYNANVNYMKRWYLNKGVIVNVDASSWYTYFTNQILPDYDSNPNQIRYANLDGHSVSKGVSLNTDVSFPNQLTVTLGATVMDVSKTENNQTTRPILTERFSGTWAVSYTTPNQAWSFDYTGNVYGPMRLPLLGALDPRPEYSPTWSIQNIQATFKKIKSVELYGGVKNVLDWTPNKSVPFLIARANDPFDEQVSYDASGNVLATAANPYALSFDPSYVYGPNQGIRFFLGFRYRLDGFL